MIGDASERLMRGVIGQSGKGDDAAGVTSGGVDAGADGVVGVVLGGHEDDGPGRRGITAGEGIATRDAGGELAEKGALTEARITIEERDLAGREPARGKPAQWLGGDLAQGDDGWERFAT